MAPASTLTAAPLTIEEAAVRLNVSVRFMRRLVYERRIAFHKVGALVRFHPADLDAFFASGRIETGVAS
jgi:excisionase family DNA binding protein